MQNCAHHSEALASSTDFLISIVAQLDSSRKQPYSVGTGSILVIKTHALYGVDSKRSATVGCPPPTSIDTRVIDHTQRLKRRTVGTIQPSFIVRSSLHCKYFEFLL